jgi:acetylornithine deacetylase/succinyl-diaminopimelate desuccinylase-like protein
MPELPVSRQASFPVDLADLVTRYRELPLPRLVEALRADQAQRWWAGLKPDTRICNGRLDANWLVKHGIPTITFGAGQNQIHTIEEFVDLDLYLEGCRMALALAVAG